MGEMPDIQIPLGFDMEVDAAMMINALSGSNSTVENGVYCIDETIVSLAATGGPLWTSIKAVATADLPAGIFCIAQGVYGNGLQGRCVFDGIFKCRVDGGTDVAVGDELIAVNAQNYLVKSTSGASNTGKCIAKALEAQTDVVGGSAGYKDSWVAFKGIAGFGHCFA